MRKSAISLFIGSLLVLLVMLNCSRSAADIAKGQEKSVSPKSLAADVQDRQQSQARILNEDGGQIFSARIESVFLSPLDPTRDSIISVTVNTEPLELAENLQLEYIFWINAAIALKSAENTFPLADYKKNDLLYVDAVLLQDSREIHRKRSLMVEILNTSPEIKGVDFPEIKGPGTYNFKINAFDADSDPLSYALEGEALPPETTIDSSGTVKITLSDKSPENIIFWVVVKDNDEGETKQEIKLSFKKELIRNKLNSEVTK